MKTLLELITIIYWEIKSRPRIGQRINTKPRLEASIIFFKRGQTVPSPYEREWLHIE